MGLDAGAEWGGVLEGTQRQGRRKGNVLGWGWGSLGGGVKVASPWTHF